MDYLKKIITAFELHAVEDIHDCFENGVDPNQVVNGKPLIYELINMYTRGPAFKSCIQAFVDHGLDFEDNVLLAVLADDAAKLDALLKANKDLLFRTYTLDCTFTPLYLSLIHI